MCNELENATNHQTGFDCLKKLIDFESSYRSNFATMTDLLTFENCKLFFRKTISSIKSRFLLIIAFLLLAAYLNATFINITDRLALFDKKTSNNGLFVMKKVKITQLTMQIIKTKAIVILAVNMVPFKCTSYQIRNRITNEITDDAGAQCAVPVIDPCHSSVWPFVSEHPPIENCKPTSTVRTRIRDGILELFEKRLG
jgi:hypothetical protein